eukprot:TRINITY_DN10393_c0_g1_i1.p1 TRINITY_DN10393_c0_g1~~TRINITY_DN10393_c0_g1_i1.p1  ORF type:complete len:358 (-),score=45.72 TRINITY_DN10393_c0_g1_i1:1-1074(-)
MEREPDLPVIKLPLEEGGEFVKSFTLTEKESYTKFFEEYGFVVIRDVLSSAEIQRSINDVWSYIESANYADLDREYMAGKVNRHEPSTWENNNWSDMQNTGFVGKNPVFTEVAFELRQHPKIYEVFSTLIGNPKLWVSIDRYALFRPTKDVLINGEKCQKPQWKSNVSLHFDTNPWTYCNAKKNVPKSEIFPPNYDFLPAFCREYNAAGNIYSNLVKVQGLVNFVDNRVEDGGFQLCPGFPKHLTSWAKATERTLGTPYTSPKKCFIVLPKDCKLYNHAQRVPLRAGSMLIWSSLMPHGSAPNDSSNMRMAQFIKLFPTPSKKDYNSQRTKVIVDKLNEANVNVTFLGQRLFGIKEW